MATKYSVNEVIWSFSSPRSGRRNKAWGGAEGGTPGQGRRAIKPVKRATAHQLSPTSWALCPLPSIPWGSRPRLYAVACSAGSKH
jgi:hypothetical protein